MGRSGAVTFKGNPMTLAGEPLQEGAAAPPFTLHFYDAGMNTLSLDDVKGKPALINVVPSLDTPVCAMQTKRFNQELAALGDKINAVTVSRDLPFAQGRFCGAEDITNMRVASDYQTGKFGEDYGLTIEELQLLARAVVVLDKDGKVVHHEVVDEVTNEPDYDKAMTALKDQL